MTNTEPTVIDRVRNEPVLVTALIQSVLALVVAFGFDLSAEQIGGILAVSAAVLAFVARSKVTPVGDDAEGDHEAPYSGL